MRPIVVTSLLAAACVAASPAVSQAYFAPGATVVSASMERLEQADDTTTQVAISGDGRYVAYTTRARNFFDDDDPDPDGAFRAGGIFVRDMTTGKQRLVAHGELRSEAAADTVLRRGALNPSLSHDGRYVVFSTGAQLVPEDTNGNVDVYLRDMHSEIGAPGAFELISKTSAGQPATYVTTGPDRPGLNLGSDIAPRSAISADGRYVVFKTADVVSDLPDGGLAETAGNQVFVRDRLTGTTTTVTRDRATGEPVGGGLGPATISADGSTVAWVGREAPRQTALVTGESLDPALDYYLLRRVADGPSAVTRRITGYADPSDPACGPGVTIAEHLTAEGPCYGPITAPEGRYAGLLATPPVMSADGTRVAYLTNAGPRGSLVVGTVNDLYLTDLRPGVSLRASTIELTREAGTTAATNAGLDAVAMSADGRWIVFTTMRTQQPLAALRVVGPTRAAATVRDLYLVDTRERTVERAGTSAAGGDPNGSVGSLPAIDAAGRRIAFISAATNLFFGDANGHQDAFVVDRLDAPPPEPPEPDAIGAPLEPEQLPPVVLDPPAPAPKRITVRARRSSKGRVPLRITLPEAATGRVRAHGRLRNAAGKRIGKTRVLASRSVKGKKRGTITVNLTISANLRKRLRTARRLTASARVEVTGASGVEYAGRVTIEFRR